ncbi:hypothetical protein [Paenibacillus jilunlii]|uniref:Uncharacterized protein n=1 Tax=Paenibacillus jilunlii TaxID=682956 RepID=A0A1G9TIX7_9BACL|nr:hypothetical protein [Paenibacillus jilunlii]KWX71974.1 hypothetical protein AML91_22840 [Paenibacillus jilunlii]SDM47729.1 hypothetical protein SAMN05216191_11371 [Paenibacillus jilunlii]
MSYIIEFLRSLFPDSTSAAISIIVTVLVFWMYKELRSNFLENGKSNQQRVDKALDIYSDIEFEIYKYLNEKSDLFIVTERISKASSLLPYDLLKSYIKFKETTEESLKRELLLKFHNDIEKEIYCLKLKQFDIVTFKNDKNIAASIEYYIKTKIAPFGIPLIYTYFNLVFLLLFILFTALIVSAPTVKEQIFLFSLVFAALFYLMFLYYIITEGFLKRRFKHSYTNWILLLLFALGLPSLVIFTGAWFSGILVFVMIFIYGYYAGRKSMRDL